MDARIKAAHKISQRLPPVAERSYIADAQLLAEAPGEALCAVLRFESLSVYPLVSTM